jgi:hypothetical protein
MQKKRKDFLGLVLHTKIDWFTIYIYDDNGILCRYIYFGRVSHHQFDLIIERDVGDGT